MMKKRIIAIFAASVLVIFALTPVFAKTVPTLFHNDEVWYRDMLSPLIERDGKYYIPVGLCDTFDFVSVRTQREDNILIYNRDTGRYISAVVSDGTAAVDGEIIGTTVFREGGTYYINAALACRILGLSSEVYRYEDTLVMRLMDGTQTKSIPELAETNTIPDGDDEMYEPTITPVKDSRKTIYVLMGSGLCEYAEECGIGFTVMLTENDGESEILRALSHGKYGIISDGDTGRLDLQNERMKKTSFVYSHVVLADGGAVSEKEYEEHGYAMIKPDFTVDDSVYAPLMADEIQKRADEFGSVIVYIKDSWNGRELIRMISEFDDTEYRTANIG